MAKKIKVFSSEPDVLDGLKNLPNLCEIQLNSYNWLIKKGFKDLFKEVFPISDYTGNELEIDFDGYFLDQPKFDEISSKEKRLTYEAPLRVNFKLTDKKSKRETKQEVYFGDFPVMTDRGTFIINGVERVVISQIVRSSGLYFTAEMLKGRKHFGAKIIPDRGAWLEFSTGLDRAIYVKIDKKRKIAVSALLRIFGLDSDEKILEAFKGTDIGEVSFIEKTIKKDASKNEGEAFMEIYRRIRPGDLATPESAKSLVEAMFKRDDRYDLSDVGRYKLNQRLGMGDKNNSRQLTIEDLIEVVKIIIESNNDRTKEPDDIDHLGNRRVRAVGEVLLSRIRVGLMRLRRVVQDRMSTYDRETLMPTQLINIRTVMAVVDEFFNTSQLSQFMNQENPLSELEHKRRMSATGPGGLNRKRAGFEVRDVHRTHYGRICPIQTPEGANVGLVSHLSCFSRLNDFGFIETPYFKVENGVVTKKLEYLNAWEEENYYIASAGFKKDKNNKITGKEVGGRYKGIPGFYPTSKIQFTDVSPFQIFSIATGLVPFVDHNDANRALMGSNMQRQAVSYVLSQAPLVGTGMEEKAAVDSGQTLVSKDVGEVMEVDANHVKIKNKNGKLKLYNLHNFKRTNQDTCLSQRPIVKVGQKVKEGQVLADSLMTDNGALALGQNLLVAFLSWGGSNYEDAIVLSERVVQEDRFTSMHIEDFYCDVRDTKLGPELTTLDIPNVSLERLKNLDEEGIVRVGAEVGSGDILVGKISPKGETDLTAEERLLRAIFGEKARDVKDTSLTMKHGKRGRIVGIRIFSRENGDKLEPGIIKRIQIQVAQMRRVLAGDKLAGRHGNKGIISKIVPVEDMPYMEDGTPVDIILNPLGVISRMNLGQILETHLGLAASKLGYRAVTPVFAGATEDEIRKELKTAGFPEDGKVVLYDGQTGRAFDQRVVVGYQYMLKLNHMVETKIHMRSIGPYSLITQQPLGGKAQLGGQRFGEMEVWALQGYGAAYALQEMLTIKSDDVMGRVSAYEAIVRGQKFSPPNIPTSFDVLINELKSMGLNVELIGGTKKFFDDDKGKRGEVNEIRGEASEAFSEDSERE